MTPARRYADWRPVAVRRVPAEWIGVGVGLLAAVLVSVVRSVPTSLTFLAFVGVAHWTKGWLVERRMRALRDDPEGGQFAVNLRLHREVAYGYDEGLVAFQDGWLVYSGRRCTFSVRRSDVQWLKVDDKRHALVFEGGAGRCGATFTTLQPGRFGKAFGEWAGVKGVPGEAVLPPIAPNGEAERLHRSWLWIGAVATLVLAVAALLSRKPSGRAIDAALAALVLPLAVAYGVQARRALARIANDLPYSRSRMGVTLGIRLPGPSWIGSVAPKESVVELSGKAETIGPSVVDEHRRQRAETRQ